MKNKLENVESLPKLYSMFMDILAGRTDDSFVTYRDLYRLVSFFRISKRDMKQILSELKDMGFVSLHNKGISLEFKVGIHMGIPGDSPQIEVGKNGGKK